MKLIGMRAWGTSKGASHLLPFPPTILFSTSHISKDWLLFWMSNNGLTPIWIVICCDSILSCNSPQAHFYMLHVQLFLSYVFPWHYCGANIPHDAIIEELKLFGKSLLYMPKPKLICQSKMSFNPILVDTK